MITKNIESNIATITFTRPEKKNAFTQKMWRDLTSCILELQSQSDVRVVILRGIGGEFCAGADISEFGKMRNNSKHAAEYEKSNVDTFATIRNCQIPTIAAIEGICFGGGFGIAAACDLRFGSDTARFCVPPAKLGLAYPVDAMQDIVNAIGPQRAKYLAYTGQVLNATEAHASGFLLDIFAPYVFNDAIDDIAQKIAKTAPLSNRATKASVNAVLSGKSEDRDHAADLGNLTFESEDYVEGRAAFAEKRDPVFRGK